MIRRSTSDHGDDKFRIISPTASWEMELPQEVHEDMDSDVFSYWQPSNPLMLQISSYKRDQGRQIGAGQRLLDRLRKEELVDTQEEDLRVKNCPDVAAVSGVDGAQVKWLYCYCVWPKLTVLLSVSAPKSDWPVEHNWALRAITTLRNING